MTFDSPMTADRYEDYLYRASTEGSNPRGRRFMELMKMKKGEKITKEEALQMAVDTYVHGIDVWQKALVDAYEAHRSEFSSLEQAVDIIRNWNRQAEIESVGMTLFRFWWRTGREYSDQIPADLIEAGETPPEAAQRVMLKALGEAVEYMRETFGSFEVPWGEAHRGKRGDRSWQLAGVADNRLVTLRAIGSGDPDENGISYARSGQSCPTVVFLKQPVTSYSAVPYGQSEHPDSPHYTDQGEKLFQHKKLKPTWFQKEDLLKNLESQKTLNVKRLKIFD
jgi:acyl-homoserine lactone acylase PvdQ